MSNGNNKKFNSKAASKENAKWINNAMKSIGAATLSSFKDIAPSISSTAGGITSTVKDATRFMKTYKDKTIGLGDNKYIKVAKKTVNNALEDLKTGNLYNEKRTNDVIAESLGFNDFDDNFDDETTTFNYVEDAYEDNANATESASLRISSAINDSTKASLSASKATIDAMVSVTEAGLMQSQKIGNQAIEHLSNIENTLSAMLDYQKENTTQFYEAAISAFEKIGSKSEDDYGSNDRINGSDLLDSRNGMNLEKYKKYVKQQLKSVKDSSGASMITDMLDETTLNMLSSNPIGTASKLIISAITPSLVKGTIENVEDTFKDFMPTMLSKLGDWRDITEKGFAASLKQKIGAIFGIKVDDKATFQTSGKITKDAAVFDGVTRNAIVEVIPKYLRESTGYLKAIAEHMHIDTKSAMESNDVYDVENNKYVKVHDIKMDLAKSIDSSQQDAYRYSKFGKALLSGGSEFKGDQAKSYEKIANELFTFLTRSSSSLQSNDMDIKNPNSEINTLLSQLDSKNKRDKTSKKVLIETLKNIQSENLGTDLISTRMKARADYNQTMGKISNDYDIKNLLAAGIDDNTNPEEFVDAILGRKGAIAYRKKLIDQDKNDTAQERKDGNKANYDANKNRSIKDIAKLGLKSYKDFNNIDSNHGSNNSNNATVDNVVDAFGNTGNHIKNGMLKLMSGAGSKEVVGEFGKIFTESMKGLWGSFKSSFIDPLSEKLFGKKGKNGYKEDGLLAGSQNKIKEAWHAVTLRLTGKSYEDSEGKTHTEETDGVKSTLSIVKDAMGNIGESIRFRLFGDKKEDNKDKTKKKPAIISGLVDSLQQGLIGWKTALFGKDDKTVEESVSKMKKTAMDSIPSAGAGAITGGLLGGAAGGSLLGTLIGGPVSGAILGIGASFIKRSNTFQNYVFGPEVKDEDGNISRIGGLVSKKTQDLLKSPGMKKSMVGGAALGLIKNVALGSSGGLLGSLVGGPVAGLVIGGGLGMLRRSEMFQTFLYGDEKKGKAGLIQHFKNIFKGNKDKDKDTEGIKKRLGMGAIGAAGGGITAALISKVGLMGAMLTPAGPIGGAVLGMAVGLSAGSKKFSKWLFGEKDEETGKQKGGMIGKLGNFMHVEVMMPLKDKMISIGDDMKNVIEHKVLDTIRITIEPIGTAIKDGIDNAKRFVFGKLKDAGDSIKKNFIDPLLTIASNALAPIKKAMNAITNVAMTATKEILKFPFKVMKKAADIITSPFRKLAVKLNNDFVKPLAGGVAKLLGKITRSIFKLVTSPLKAAAAVSTVARQNIGDKFYGIGRKFNFRDHTDDGTYNSEKRRSELEYREQRKLNRQSKRERENKSKNRREMAKILGYDEKYFTEENAKAALDKINSNRGLFQRKKKMSDLFVGGNNRVYDIDPEAEAKKLRESLEGKSNDDIVKGSDGKGAPIDVKSLQEETKIRMGIDKLVQFFTGKNLFGNKADNTGNNQSSNNSSNNDNENDSDSSDTSSQNNTNNDVDNLVDEMNEAGGIFKWAKNKAKNTIHGVKNDALEDYNRVKNGVSGIKGKFNDIKNKFSLKGRTRANGGNIESDNPYLVGDGGKDPSAAEIVVPKTSGKVLSQKGNGIKVFIDGISNSFKLPANVISNLGNAISKSLTNASKDNANSNVSLNSIPGASKSSLFDNLDLSSMDAATRKSIYRNAKKNGISIGHLADDNIDGEKKKQAALDILSTNEDKKKNASYEGQKAIKDAALEKLEDKKIKQQIAENTRQASDNTKRSLWEWLKLFGKGGLILTAAVRLYPVIKKALYWLSDPLGKLVGNIKVDLGFGLKNLKDGNNLITNLGEQVSSLADPIVDFFAHPTHLFKDLKKVVFGQDDDGNGAEIDYNTGSKINYARSMVKTQTDKIHKHKVIADKVLGHNKKYAARKAKKEEAAAAKKALSKQKAKDNYNIIKKNLGLKYNKTADLTKYTEDELMSKYNLSKDEFVKTFGNDPDEWNSTLAELEKDSKSSGAKSKGRKSIISKIKNKVTKKSVTEASEDVAEKGAREAGENITKTGTKAATKVGKSTQKGLISKVIKYLKEGINFVFNKCGKNLASKGAAEGGEKALQDGAKKGLGKTLTKVVEVLTKYFPRIMPKVVAILSAAGGLVATGVGAIVQAVKTVGWTGASAINEASNPRRLFQISAKDNPDWIMFVISVAIGALKGFDPAGPIIDIVDTLVASITGVSPLTEVAIFMYDCIVKFLGMSDKSEALKTKRDKQKKSYEKYADDKNKKEYESYLKSKGTTSSKYSYDQYKSDVNSGKIKGAKVDSFIDYNAKSNKTIGAKIADGALSLGSKVGNIGKSIFGSKKKGYYDPTTKIYYYPTKSDGISEMFKSEGVDKNGNPVGKMTSLGKINTANMPDKSNMTQITQSKKGIISDIGSGIVNVAKGIINTVRNVGKPTLDYLLDNKDTIDLGYPKNGPGKPIISFIENSLMIPTTAPHLMIQGAKYIAKKLGTVIVDTEKVGASAFTSISSYISGKTKNIDFSVAKTNPIKPVFDLMGKVFSTLLYPIRMIGKFANSAGKVVKNAGKNIWNKTKSARNSITSAFKFLTGNNGGNGIGGNGDTVNNYPYYSQKDPRWSNMDYSSKTSKGTMEKSGCGPTAMAMVASKYTKDKRDPVSIAKDAEANGFRDSTGTNSNFIDAESGKFGLNSSKKIRPTAEYILNNVGNGKSMIINGIKTGGDSVFTSAGHYVVAVGKDKKGNVLINDPRGKNYSKAVSAKTLSKDSRISWAYNGSRNHGGYGQNIVRTIYKQIGGEGGNKYTAEDVIKIALGEEGYLEKASSNNLNDKTKNAGSGNHTKYEKDVFGSSGNFWCASFVSWCHYMAANKNKSAASKVLGALSMSADGIRQALATKNAYDKNPKPGDCIFFSGSRHAGANHIGIVYKVSGNTVYTIEGNTSSGNTVVDNGGTVAKKSYSINESRILGFGHPNYDGSSDFSGDTSSNSSDATTDSSSSNTDVLSKISDITDQYVSKATTGVLTGNWNYDFNSSNSSSTSDSTSSSDTSGTTYDVVNASNVDLKGLVDKFGNADLKSIPHVSAKQIKAALKANFSGKGVFKKGNEENDANGLYKAQEDQGLSAIVPMAIGALESGWGSSSIAKGKGNLWGWGAVNSNPYGGAKAFDPNDMGKSFGIYSNELLSKYYKDYGAKSINSIGTGSNPAKKGYAYGNDGSISKTWAPQVVSTGTRIINSMPSGKSDNGGSGGFGDGISYRDIRSSNLSGNMGDTNILDLLNNKTNKHSYKTSIGGNGSNNILRNEMNSSNTKHILNITNAKKNLSTTSKIETLLENVCTLLESIDTSASGSKKILSGLNNGTTTNNVIVSKYPNATNKTSSNVSNKKAQSLQMSSSKTNANLAAKLAKG